MDNSELIGVFKKTLNDERVKLALAGGLVQVTNFSWLLFSKATVTDSSFVFLITQLSIAGVVGTIASFRLEILLFQINHRVTSFALFATFGCVAASIIITYMIMWVLGALLNDFPALSPITLPLLVSLALNSVLSFVLVQIKRLNLLLCLRILQTVPLFVFCTINLTTEWMLNGDDFLLALGFFGVCPTLLACIFLLSSLAQGDNVCSYRVLLERSVWRRALLLTFSTGINSLYVNLPVLVAAATQSVGFVADFGLILRSISAPITLASQVFGRLFLATAMSWSISAAPIKSDLAVTISKTMVQSVIFYVFTTIPLLLVLLTFRTYLNLNETDIVPYIFFAGLGQCVVNSISQVRIPLRDEQVFSIFDCARLLILFTVLYGMSGLLPFEFAFSVTSLFLYGSYILFIFRRVKSFSVR